VAGVSVVGVVWSGGRGEMGGGGWCYWCVRGVIKGLRVLGEAGWKSRWGLF